MIAFQLREAIREALFTHVPRITDRKIDTIIHRVEVLSQRPLPGYEKPGTNGVPLARCPFCDGDQLQKRPNDLADKPGNLGMARIDPFYVHCEGCGCDGPVGDTELEAVQLWNQRAIAAPCSPAAAEFASSQPGAV